ncbi:MFS transporter [Salibacterium sp. K-3]
MNYFRLVLPGIAMVAIIYGLSRYTYGLFVPYIRKDFGISTETVGFIASSSYISYMVTTLVVPFLIAKCGAKLPLILGGCTATIGMMVIGLSQTIGVLAAGVMIAGASPGLSYPPVPEIVNKGIKKKKRTRALTIINCGTGFGVLLGGPMALFAGEEWRLAWIAFGVIALCVTTWNLWAISPLSFQNQKGGALPKIKGKWLLEKDKRNLILLTLLIGITTSAYWTYAVDFVVNVGGFTMNESQFFWFIMGAAGVLGAFGGHLIEAIGLANILRINIFGIALSLAVLAAFPSAWGSIIISAVLFGIFFIMITGIFAVWSVRVFEDQPSIGYALVFFLITAGQFVGPSIMGIIAGQTNMTFTFYLSAIMTVSITILGPSKE